MISFLLNLLLMTLLLSLFGTAALFFRRKWLRGKGGAMYAIWACVLLLGVVPLRLFPELNLTGNFDPDSLMPEKMILPGSENDIVLPEVGDFKLSLISSPDSVDARERLNALYAIQPKVITGGLDMTAERLLDKTESYLFPFFGSAVLVWSAGALMSFLGTLVDYGRMKRRLTAYSALYDFEMDDGRLALLLEEARLRVGIRRRVNIRIVDSPVAVSPCVCGVIRPVIFLGEELLHMEEDQLALILTHELVHCHRFELVYKTAVSAVSAMHWFNPLMPALLRAVYEDCELSCDSRVLSLCGENLCDYYMMTLLDVAEIYCHSGYNGDRAMASGVYLAGSTGKSFLKKRYLNMKCEPRKGVRKGSVIFLALCLVTNIVVMSACGVGEVYDAVPRNMAARDTSDNAIYSIHPIGAAVCNYLGLVEGSELTDKQFAMIQSIDVELVKRADDFGMENCNDTTMLRIYINGTYEPSFGKMLRADDMTELFRRLKAYSDVAYKKLNAYYVLKDSNDASLDEKAIAELLACFPMTAEHALYILDPYADEREIHYLSMMLQSCGGYVPFEKTAEGLQELAERYIAEYGLDCSLSVQESVLTADNLHF